MRGPWTIYVCPDDCVEGSRGATGKCPHGHRYRDVAVVPPADVVEALGHEIINNRDRNATGDPLDWQSAADFIERTFGEANG